MILRWLMGQYCDRDEYSPTFLKTGHTADRFHRLGKHFSIRKLNNFAKIRDSSGLSFLRTTTGILSRWVAFIESRLLMSVETFIAEIVVSQRLCSVSWGKSGKRWQLSCNMELETKIIAKNLALPDKDNFRAIDNRMYCLQLLRILLVIFQNLQETNLLHIYGLPKIHKCVILLRPIVSWCQIHCRHSQLTKKKVLTIC